MIVPLDPHNKDHRRAAALLHGGLLPDSPIAGLGRGFMENFYYDKLIRDGLVSCDLYFDKGNCVAFAAYTREPFTFLSRGKKGHFFFLSLLLTGSLLAKPSRARIILDTLRLEKRRSSPAVLASGKKDGVGELLSFAVNPAYSGFRDPIIGKKIPNLLFDRVIDHFRKGGYRKIQFIVRKDNHASLLFFNSYGAEVSEADYIGSNAFLLSLSL